jgi:hypothetical protein
MTEMCIIIQRTAFTTATAANQGSAMPGAKAPLVAPHLHAMMMFARQKCYTVD